MIELPNSREFPSLVSGIDWPNFLGVFYRLVMWGLKVAWAKGQNGVEAMSGKKLVFLIALSILYVHLSNQKLAAKDVGVDEPVKQVKSQTKRPRMDLAFCIDTTGSMQSEIDMVKAKVKELVAKLASGKPAPDIRVAMVAFRDRGDEYVTKNYAFTDDIDQFVKDIQDLKANGGGDGPEAVCQALHASVNDLDWDKSNKTSKLLFLIGDAGPKTYKNDFKWDEESRKAIAQGIQINTIGCQGLQSYPGLKGMDVFKQIAKLADGQFELLAYKQTITKGDGSRATLVTAGGESYELSSGASADEWKKGASALVKEGKAKRYASAKSISSYSRSAKGGMGFADAEAMPSAAPVSVNREANNLDSILINAAKQKAAKDLKVDYKD